MAKTKNRANKRKPTPAATKRREFVARMKKRSQERVLKIKHSCNQKMDKMKARFDSKEADLRESVYSANELIKRLRSDCKAAERNHKKAIRLARRLVVRYRKFIETIEKSA